MILVWVGFLLFVFTVLAVDLGVFNRKDQVPTGREAIACTTATIVLALVFSVAARMSSSSHCCAGPAGSLMSG